MPLPAGVSTASQPILMAITVTNGHLLALEAGSFDRTFYYTSTDGVRWVQRGFIAVPLNQLTCTSEGCVAYSTVQRKDSFWYSTTFGAGPDA